MCGTLENNQRYAMKTSLGLTQLMLTAKEGNLRRCLQLLEAGESADERTELGVTLLHLAAVNKKHGMHIIEHFLPPLAGCPLKDEDGEEPIHYAVREGNFGAAQMLLKARKTTARNLLHFFLMDDDLEMVKLVHAHDRQQLTKADSEGRTALHLAAESSSPKMCDWIVSQEGADLEAPGGSSKATALHFATLNEPHATEIIACLAAKGANMDARTTTGETPLHWALLRDKTDIAESLLSNGAKIEKIPDLMLFFVERNMVASARFVHQQDKRQIKARDSKGRNAIHVAAEKADLEMCQWLLEAGVELTALGGERKSTVLHHVGFNETHGAGLVRFFVSLGFSLGKRDDRGETPLHCALSTGNVAVAAEMVKRGADPEVQVNGQNLLHLCVRQNNLQSAKFVHETDAGLIKECDRRGRNAVHLAAKFADREMCEWLVAQGARVFVSSREFGNNVLHFAARNRRHGRRILRLFVKSPRFGFKIHVPNKVLETPLHLALVSGNLEAADELFRLGADPEIRIDTENLIHYLACWADTLASAKLVHQRYKRLVKEPCLGGMTALHHAARRGDHEFCRWLVKAGVDTRARTMQGETALAFVPDHDVKLKNYFLKLGIEY